MSSVKVPSLDPGEITPTSSGRVVYVGCKLPHGIRLELFPHQAPPKTEGELRMLFSSHRAVRSIAHVDLRGANSIDTEQSLRKQSNLVFPFAVTEVDAAFWEAWVAVNADKPFLKNGQVFCVGEKRAAVSEAKNRVIGVQTGLEPLKTDAAQDERIKQNVNSTLDERMKVRPDPERLSALQATAVYRGGET